MRTVWPFPLVILMLSLATGLMSACSPNSVPDRTGYRDLNLSCSKINLASSTLDVKTFRSLLDCFDSNGALTPITRLAHKMGESELNPLIDFLNSSVLSRPEILFQLENAHEFLKKSGQADATIAAIGAFLFNEDLAVSTLQLLRNRDALFYKGLQRIEPRLTELGIQDFLDAALSVFSSRSAHLLLPRFLPPPTDGRSLKQITDQILDLNAELGRDFLNLLASEQLFMVLDPLSGVSPAEMRRNIPRLASVFRQLMTPTSETSAEPLVGGISALFRFTHRPISCLKGGAIIPDSATFMMSEIAKRKPDEAPVFIQRENLIALSTLGSFCDLPAEIGTYYPSLVRFSETTPMLPAAELIQKSFQERPAADFIVKLLSDPSFPNQIPLLQELDSRNIWPDFLLLMNTLPFRSRHKLAKNVRFFLEPSPELDGKSLYDLLQHSLRRADPTVFWRWISGLHVAARQGFAEPLTAFRNYSYAGNTHPWIKTAKELLAQAPRNEPFFESFFKMSEDPDFRDSVHLLSVMSKDGRLRQLLDAFFMIFHKFASHNGLTATDQGSIPDFVPLRRHNLDSNDLEVFSVLPLPSAASPSCKKVNPVLDLAAQTLDLSQCINSDSQHSHASMVVRSLTEATTEDGRTLLSWTSKQLKNIPFDREENRFLVREMLEFSRSSRLDNLLSAIPLFVGDAALPASETLRPLTRMPAPLLKENRSDLNGVFSWIGSSAMLKNPDFPRAIEYVDHLVNSSSRPQPPSAPYPINEIHSALQKWECRNPTPFTERTRELISDFEDSVTGWENLDGAPRHHWPFQVFFDKLDPELNRFSDPSFTEALLRLLRFFSLEDGEAPSAFKHFTPRQLAAFLDQKSRDLSIVPYLYPERQNPRAKLLNSLDRLELLLVNSDILAPGHGNAALRFTSAIANAWGDEPPELWPEEIRHKFRDKPPHTLEEALTRMEDFQHDVEKAALPSFPSCEAGNSHFDFGRWRFPWFERHRKIDDLRRSVFNIHTMIPVLRENLPDPQNPDNPSRLGMKFLRDLFFVLSYATPSEFRNPRSGENNHISFALKLVRMGVVRQMGRLIWRLPRKPDGPNPSLTDFVGALVATGSSPASKTILTELLNPPERPLFWSPVKQILALYQPDRPQGGRNFQSLIFDSVALAQQKHWVNPFLDQLAKILIQSRTSLASNVARILETEALTPLDAPGPARWMEKLYHAPDSERSVLTERVTDALKTPELGPQITRLLLAFYQNPVLREAASDFFSRWNAVKESPSFQSLRLERVLRPLLEYVEEKSPDPVAVSSARKLRFSTAQMFSEGEFERLLTLIAKDPDRFHEIFEALRDASASGEMKDFFGFVDRALSAQ